MNQYTSSSPKRGFRTPSVPASASATAAAPSGVATVTQAYTILSSILRLPAAE